MVSKLLTSQLAKYSSHHRHLANRLLHGIGVPAITLSLLVAASEVVLLRADTMTVTLAWAIALTVFLYWILLDPVIGTVAALLHVPLVWVALPLAQLTTSTWVVFLALFLGGWIFQFIGHGIEGRRPALLDNLAQIFIAPFFLVAEVLFALGLRPAVRQAIEARWRSYLPSDGS